MQYQLDNNADGRYCLSSATKNPMLLPCSGIGPAQGLTSTDGSHRHQEIDKKVKPKPVVMKTKLITREGYNALKAEHDELWFEKRPEVTKIVTWAASLGDRSENADYQLVPLYITY